MEHFLKCEWSGALAVFERPTVGYGLFAGTNVLTIIFFLATEQEESDHSNADEGDHASDDNVRLRDVEIAEETTGIRNVWGRGLDIGDAESVDGAREDFVTVIINWVTVFVGDRVIIFVNGGFGSLLIARDDHGIFAAV